MLGHCLCVQFLEYLILILINMYKRTIIKKRYEGLGFVELIIAMGVAGIALIVLMTMAANSMREAVRYERHDALTRLATSGALVVRSHSEEANAKNDVFFSVSSDRCYKIDFDGRRVISPNPQYEKNSLDDKVLLQTKIIYNEPNDLGDVYYVAYCVDAVQAGTVGVNTYIGYVETGYVDCRSCGIEPYKQPVLINILPD